MLLLNQPASDVSIVFQTRGICTAGSIDLGSPQSCNSGLRNTRNRVWNYFPKVRLLSLRLHQAGNFQFFMEFPAFISSETLVSIETQQNGFVDFRSSTFVSVKFNHFRKYRTKQFDFGFSLSTSVELTDWVYNLQSLFVQVWFGFISWWLMMFDWPTNDIHYQ